MENKKNLESTQEVSTFGKDLLEISLKDTIQDQKTTFWSTLKYKWEKFHEVQKEFGMKFPLIGYTFKRILFALITLTITISILFIMVRTITPDENFLNGIAFDKMGIQVNTPEYFNLLENRMKQFGIYGSIWEQLGRYLYYIIPIIPKEVMLDPMLDSAGNLYGPTTTVWLYLGAVFSNSVGQPGSQVTDVFANAIPYSFAFGAVGITITYLLGIPLGIYAAKNKGKFGDGAINGVAVLITSIPPVVFVSSIYLLTVFVFGAHGTFLSGTLDTKLLPVLVIVLMQIPMVIINTRRYVVDEMTADYTKFAASKGMSDQKVFYVHIFRNAGIRIIRMFPIALLGTLFGASIFTETNWQIPGMSRFIVAGIANRDTFVILGYVVFSSTIGVFTTLLADLLMALLDPRIKITK